MTHWSTTRLVGTAALVLALLWAGYYVAFVTGAPRPGDAPGSRVSQPIATPADTR